MSVAQKTGSGDKQPDKHHNHKRERESEDESELEKLLRAIVDLLKMGVGGSLPRKKKDQARENFCTNILDWRGGGKQDAAVVKLQQTVHAVLDLFCGIERRVYGFSNTAGNVVLVHSRHAFPSFLPPAVDRELQCYTQLRMRGELWSTIALCDCDNASADKYGRRRPAIALLLNMIDEAQRELELEAEEAEEAEEEWKWRMQ